jgi:triacylglycerol lipase
MNRFLKRLAAAAAALAALTVPLVPVPAAAASGPAVPPSGSVLAPSWTLPGGGPFPGFPWLPPGFGPGFPWLPPNNPPPKTPPPNPTGFPADFKAPVNAKTGRPVTGWGCDSKSDGGAVRHTPVLFVHGATRNASDFDQERQYFLDHGYTPCETWAVTYGYGSMQNPETNDGSVPTVQAFIRAMMDYLKQHKNANVTQIDIVTHSLGGTVVRKWLANTGETRLVRSFVEIAGPNHGTAICRGATSSSPVCQEIAPGTRWLADLNARGEAPKGVRTMTVYDGTGQYDFNFDNTLKESAALKGATNHPYNVEHGTRLDHLGLINGTASLQLGWLKDDYVAAKKP